MKKRLIDGNLTIRQVNINGVQYYVYDLPYDKRGKEKRLYGRTKEELKAKIDSHNRIYKALKNGIVSDAQTFPELYRCFLEQPITEQQREVYTNYIPLISSLLVEDLSVLNKSHIIAFLEKIAPERSNKAMEDFSKMLNKVLFFGAKENKIPSIEISSSDIQNINDNKKSIEPAYSLTDYKKVLEKFGQRCGKDNKFKYGIAYVIIPFLMDTNVTIMNLTDVKWKHILQNRIYLPSEDKTYHMSDETIQRICEYHKNDYLTSYPNGFTKEDIGYLPQEDVVFTSAISQIYHVPEHLRMVLFRLGLPDNTTTFKFIAQIRNLKKSAV